LKFVALLAPKIVGGTEKIQQSLDTPTLPFVKILMGKNQRQNTAIAATGIIGVADI